MSSSEIKPTAFKRGWPKKTANGLFGLEQHLIDHPDKPVVAVVVFAVDDVIDKQLKGEQYPIVEVRSIEPIHDDSDVSVLQKIAAAAREARTGAAELPIDDKGTK